MNRLHQLKKGDIARFVCFENEGAVKMKCETNGIFEGSIINVISSIGVIVFRINSKVFSMNKNIAKQIRVIRLIRTIKVS